jgi:arabinogalactan endo-1,4-beta-galactosidase
MRDLANHYQKDLVVVEYSACKEQVNALAFNLPESRGLGTFIWEPLNTWEKIFDQNGQANSLMALYDDISKKYLERR